ncbi:MAG: UDP-3-O-(3-hydroxymyristoyl)glucosamine N-acyltransferase [Candidatus Brocadiia bacterium]|jgi:UDP-3-O-[3-hydroxymyristoyl] glucosamine N-acyltransferase|nr:UDP-3-O-(3-hydroxymyristoyl)glucosamine N-acyltransferase [Candidatus Brocadiia bacterium]
MMSFTTQQIAELAGGELHGGGDVRIGGVHSLDAAGQGDLAFVTGGKMHAAAARSAAGALLTAELVDGYDGPQIVCGDPELSVAKLLEQVHELELPRPEGVSEAASISPGARLGRGVSVGACAVIEEGAVLGDEVTVYPLSYVGRGSRLGARTIIHAHVTVYAGVQVGEDCILHSGCVVGADGFRYIQREGRSVKLAHVAGVRIGSGVEIGANACVDRGMVEDTVIGDGVKIDNHCNVAHNCSVGDHTIMAGYARLAGSVRVGQGVMMGADARVVDHMDIGDGVKMAAGTTVLKNAEPGAVLLGTPAYPAREGMRILAMQSRLPDMHRKLVALQKEVEEIKARLAEALAERGGGA